MSLAILAFAAVSPSSASAQDGNAAGSTLDGVFTEAQAQRGQSTFTDQCSACHAQTEFQGPIWSITWTGRTAGAFVDLLVATMPLDSPGSLSRQQYADIVAYVLSLNGYPTGDTELPADSDTLGNVRIEAPPDADR